MLSAAGAFSLSPQPAPIWQPVLDSKATTATSAGPFSAFAHVCARSQAATVAEEYHDLFVGLVRGELVPFGSYYLTGFLHEKPLAQAAPGHEPARRRAPAGRGRARGPHRLAVRDDGGLHRRLVRAPARASRSRRLSMRRTSAVGRPCSSATWKRRKHPSSTPHSDRSAASSSASRRARSRWSSGRLEPGNGLNWNEHEASSVHIQGSH